MEKGDKPIQDATYDVLIPTNQWYECTEELAFPSRLTCCTCGVSTIGKKVLFVIRTFFIPKNNVIKVEFFVRLRMMCVSCAEERHLPFKHHNDKIPSIEHVIQSMFYAAAEEIPGTSTYPTAETYVDAVFERMRIQNNEMMETYAEKELYPNGKFCWKCKKTGCTLFRCSKCFFVLYCSKECQRSDWIKHTNRECKSLSNSREPPFGIVQKTGWIVLKKI